MSYMIWSEVKEPNDKVSYNHVTLDTPLGEYIVDWKGWKETPSYDVSLNSEYIGSNYDLESGKDIAESHLLETANQLNGFISESK